MNFLRRFFGSRDDVPAWARFFDPAAYRAFLETVRTDMVRRGAEVDLAEGMIHVRLPGEEPSEYGLLNLAQVCNATPRGEWEETVREHFDRAMTCTVEARKLDARAGRLEDVRRALKVRLYHAEYLEQIGAERLVCRIPAPGLVETLVYDLPGSVRTVPPEHLGKWEAGKDELFRMGLENVRAEGKPPVQTFDLERGAQFFGLVGDSFFTSSHAMLLGEYVDPMPEMGLLVSVPHRHSVLYHPIVDLRAVLAINSMIPVTFGMHQEGPGSVSPHLYWVKDGAWTMLPSKVTSQSITFTPPDEFVQTVLNRLPDAE